MALVLDFKKINNCVAEINFISLTLYCYFIVGIDTDRL